MVSPSRQTVATLVYSVSLAFLPLIGSSLVTYAVIENQAFIETFGWAEWLLLYVLAAFTMAYALTPTTFVALVSGYLLGWVALPFLCISYLAAAWIGYQTVTRIDNGKLLDFLSQRKGVQAFVQKLQQGSLGVIVLSRLSPVLPFAVMNAVFSLVKIPVRPFLWGSFGGMLPRTVLSVWVGTQAQQLQALLKNPNENLSWRVGLITLTLVSVAGLGYGLQKLWRSK